MWNGELTSALETVLRDTVITDDSPGTLLHDFQTMLDFVRETEPTLTQSQLLKLQSLRPLNTALKRSIDHGLTRPRQKSFPNINGLYLLLRVSGLTVVQIREKEATLILNEPVVEIWNNLNADERYVALLENWLFRGDEAVLGERGGLLGYNRPFWLWAEFVRDMLMGRRRGDDWITFTRYRPKHHNLALMELFGLVRITDGPTVHKQAWQIEDVQITAWGQAVAALLIGTVLEDDRIWNRLDSDDEWVSDLLYETLIPYRPKLQQQLVLPAQSFQPGSYVFKVSLSPSLWRRITIDAEATLETFSDAILRAYQFDHDHLYLFRYPSPYGRPIQAFHPYMQEQISVDEVRIGDLGLQAGSQLLYNYDFGDDWRFDVLLERIDAADPTLKGYRLGEKRGRSPQQYR